jgi:hypothetical protein
VDVAIRARAIGTGAHWAGLVIMFAALVWAAITLVAKPAMPDDATRRFSF